MPPNPPPDDRPSGNPAIAFQMEATKLTAVIRRWVEQTRHEMRQCGRGVTPRLLRLREALIQAGLNVKEAVELVHKATAIRREEERW